MTTLDSVLNKYWKSEEFNAALTKHITRVDRKSERTFEAPDPVAAWAFLKGCVDTLGTLTGVPYTTARAIYRGQSNASWGLLPTLLRLNKSKQRAEKEAAKHFADIVQVEFNVLWSADIVASLPPLHPRSGEASAQHNGMQTSLLDWTSSYSVGIDFATKKADGNLAAVWWLYLSDVERCNLRLILAPPYVQRLYLQRGLFTDIESEKVASTIENIAYKIVFPATHHEKTRKVVNREIQQINSLLPVDQWFDTLRDYCNSTTGRKRYLIGQSAVAHSLQFSGYLNTLENPPKMPWQYVGNDLGISMWLGEDGVLRQIPEYILALGKRVTINGTVSLDETVRKLLDREDPEFFKWSWPLIETLI